MVMPTDVLTDAEARMKKAVEVLERDMDTVRTGRANPALVELVQIDYHGVPMPLNQLASISAPEARLLVVQPWDRQAISAIEKGILRSELGLTPTNDGTVLRLAIPILTEDRRRQLVRLVKSKTEDGRVTVRNIRRDALERLRSMDKNKEVSQDDARRAIEQLQKITDSFVAQMDQRLATKESEVMQT